jgi:hypothetical protein
MARLRPPVLLCTCAVTPTLLSPATAARGPSTAKCGRPAARGAHSAPRATAEDGGHRQRRKEPSQGQEEEEEEEEEDHHHHRAPGAVLRLRWMTPTTPSTPPWTTQVALPSPFPGAPTPLQCILSGGGCPPLAPAPSSRALQTLPRQRLTLLSATTEPYPISARTTTMTTTTNENSSGLSYQACLPSRRCCRLNRR